MLTSFLGFGPSVAVLTVGTAVVCLLLLLFFRRLYVLIAGAGADTGGWAASFVCVCLLSWNLTGLTFYLLAAPPSIDALQVLKDDFNALQPIDASGNTIKIVVSDEVAQSGRADYVVEFAKSNASVVRLAVIRFSELKVGSTTTSLQCRIAVPGDGTHWNDEPIGEEAEFEYQIADFEFYQMKASSWLTPFTFTVETPASVHVFEKALKYAFEYINEETDTYEKADYQQDENSERTVVRNLSNIVKARIGNVPREVKVARMFNGPIQWCTLWAFFALLLKVGSRYVTYVLFETLMISDEVRDEIGKVAVVSSIAIGELEKKAQEANAECRRKTSLLGCKTSTAKLELFSEAAAAFMVSSDYKAVPEFVDSRAGTILDDRSARQGFVKYLLWAIPSIGFVGTVVGIGAALLETINVDAVNPAEAAIAKSMVSSSIGVAFDTTLVALLLSLVGMLVFHVVSQLEEVLVTDAAADIRRRFIRPGEQIDDENRLKSLVRDLFKQWEKLHTVNENLEQLSSASSTIDTGFKRVSRMLSKQAELIKSPGKKINAAMVLSGLAFLGVLALLIWKAVDHFNLLT